MSIRQAHGREVLLIGGAGYIGSVLTGHLLRAGYRVRCLDLLLYQNSQAILSYVSLPEYRFMHGDLTDPTTLKSALKGVSDVVVLAGLVGDPITKKYPDASNRINHHGMIQAIRQLNGSGLNRVIFISTCSNYGLIPEDTLADEEYELSPLSLYAKAKVAVEQELLSQKGKVDYSATVLRFATAFGLSPRMRFDLSVNEFVREMYLNKDLLVFDAHTWRPYCHVLDFSRIIQKVLEAPEKDVSFQIFNAGGEINNATKQTIIDTLRKHLPEAPVRYQEQGPDPRNYKVDFSKIRSVLGFQPEHTIDSGVREIIGALKEQLFSGVDANRNFYGNYEIRY